MSARARIIKGIGRETNPIDGDRIVIELGLRDGKIAYIGADIRTGVTTLVPAPSPAPSASVSLATPTTTPQAGNAAALGSMFDPPPPAPGYQWTRNT